VSPFHRFEHQQTHRLSHLITHGGTPNQAHDYCHSRCFAGSTRLCCCAWLCLADGSKAWSDASIRATQKQRSVRGPAKGNAGLCHRPGTHQCFTYCYPIWQPCVVQPIQLPVVDCHSSDCHHGWRQVTAAPSPAGRFCQGHLGQCLLLRWQSSRLTREGLQNFVIQGPSGGGSNADSWRGNKSGIQPRRWQRP